MVDQRSRTRYVGASAIPSGSLTFEGVNLGSEGRVVKMFVAHKFGLRSVRKSYSRIK